jgi:hypothetical protein
VLARLRELAAFVLDFLEQPHVLDGDHRLISEGGDQLDLGAREEGNGHTAPALGEGIGEGAEGAFLKDDRPSLGRHRRLLPAGEQGVAQTALFQRMIAVGKAIVELDWMGRWVPLCVDERDLDLEAEAHQQQPHRRRKRRVRRGRRGRQANNQNTSRDGIASS